MAKMGSARKNFREEPLPARITKVINLHIFVECRVVFRPLEREKSFKSTEAVPGWDCNSNANGLFRTV